MAPPPIVPAEFFASLAHVSEKWEPVFRQEHARNQEGWCAMAISRKVDESLAAVAATRASPRPQIGRAFVFGRRFPKRHFESRRRKHGRDSQPSVRMRSSASHARYVLHRTKHERYFNSEDLFIIIISILKSCSSSRQTISVVH
jgi:hypothetical protein